MAGWADMSSRRLVNVIWYRAEPREWKRPERVFEFLPRQFFGHEFPRVRKYFEEIRLHVVSYVDFCRGNKCHFCRNILFCYHNRKILDSRDDREYCNKEWSWRFHNPLWAVVNHNQSLYSMYFLSILTWHMCFLRLYLFIFYMRK